MAVDISLSGKQYGSVMTVDSVYTATLRCTRQGKAIMLCKQCGAEIGKGRPNQLFCCQEHKDGYHNRAKAIGERMALDLDLVVLEAIQHRAKASQIPMCRVIEYMAAEFLREYLPAGYKPREK